MHLHFCSVLLVEGSQPPDFACEAIEHGKLKTILLGTIMTRLDSASATNSLPLPYGVKLGGLKVNPYSTNVGERPD